MTTKLVDDVEKMLEMFEMKVHDFSLMDVLERRVFENEILGQYQPVCQGAIDSQYVIDTLEGSSHVITLNVNKLVIGMAILREQNGATKYMEADIICAREHSRVGRLIVNACENLARSMNIGAISLSSVPNAIGFYRKLGYIPIPKSRICDEPRGIDHEILIIYDRATDLVKIQNEEFSGGVGESDSPVKTLLVNLGMDPEKYVSMAGEFTDHIDMWNIMLEGIDVEELFDDGNLIMTKCLFNNPQNDLGVVDIGVTNKRQRTTKKG